jgi:prepilin-type N-terminal cleavage/methylation domain-containing protein
MRLRLSFGKNRPVRRRAFTLIEVMVCAGISGFLFLSLYSGIAQGFSSLQRAREKLRATQILMDKLEVIRLYNWDQINTDGFIPSTFTDYYYPLDHKSDKLGTVYHGAVTLTAADVDPAYADTMRRIVAEVTWIHGGVSHHHRMETLVSEYGVQNYIY